MTTQSDELLSTLAQKASPAHAALVVVDVQNDFAADGGYFDKVGADIKKVQRSIPPLVNLIDRAREAGVLVVFVQAIYDPPNFPAPMRERDRLNKREGMLRCIAGSWGADFYMVRPLPGEPVVTKHCYSGVINTKLDAVLKQHGVKSLLMTGISTDTCVESTARDAFFIDYYVTLVEDCCGAMDETDHAGACKRFARDYGPVVTSADVIDAWEESGAFQRRPVAARAAG